MNRLYFNTALQWDGGAYDPTSNSVIPISPFLSLATYTNCTLIMGNGQNVNAGNPYNDPVIQPVLPATTTISYTSGIIDSGSQQTQWALLEWAQTYFGVVSATISIGNTIAPDVSWTSLTLLPSIAQTPGTQSIIMGNLPSATRTQVTSAPNATGTLYCGATAPGGQPYAVAGLQALPRAQYCQFTIVLQANALAWIRDAQVFWWLPEVDGTLLLKAHGNLATNTGPTMQAFAVAMLATLTQSYNYTQSMTTSYAATKAVDDFLFNELGDFGLYPPYAAMPQRGLQQCILYHITSNGSGPQHGPGSTYFLQMSIANLLGMPVDSVTVLPGGSPLQYEVRLPAPVTSLRGPEYPGLPGVPISMVSTLISWCFFNGTPGYPIT